MPKYKGFLEEIGWSEHECEAENEEEARKKLLKSLMEYYEYQVDKFLSVEEVKE